MLLRGRPRTLGAAALLLLLLIGFFLFGGDPDCELGGEREAGVRQVVSEPHTRLDPQGSNPEIERPLVASQVNSQVEHIY